MTAVANLTMAEGSGFAKTSASAGASVHSCSQNIAPAEPSWVAEFAPTRQMRDMAMKIEPINQRVDETYWTFAAVRRRQCVFATPWVDVAESWPEHWQNGAHVRWRSTTRREQSRRCRAVVARAQTERDIAAVE